jgi:hypothetical protein
MNGWKISFSVKLLAFSVSAIFFVKFIHDGIQIYLQILENAKEIKLTSGFGVLAIAGIAPFIVLLERRAKKEVAAEKRQRLFRTHLVIPFLILCMLGAAAEISLRQSLRLRGYKPCVEMERTSGKPGGEILIYKKTQCE